MIQYPSEMQGIFLLKQVLGGTDESITYLFKGIRSEAAGC